MIDYENWVEEMTQKRIREHEQEIYQQGLNDAWECAKKIYGMDKDTRMLALVFNNYEVVFDYYSASEAIEKIKEYEEKKKAEEEIKVGDEVFTYDTQLRAIVTKIDAENCCIVSLGGETQHIWKHCLKKTGRHFPQIAEVLEHMKEDIIE